MSVMGWKNYTLGAITRGFLWVGKCIIGRCVKYENDESATNLISFRVLLANIEDLDDDENDEDCRNSAQLLYFFACRKLGTSRNGRPKGL